MNRQKKPCPLFRKIRETSRVWTGVLAALLAVLFLLGCPPFSPRGAAAQGGKEKILSSKPPVAGLGRTGKNPAAGTEEIKNEETADGEAAGRTIAASPESSAAASGEQAPPAAAAEKTAQVSPPPARIIQRPLFSLSSGRARPGEPVTIGYSDTFLRTRSLQAALIDSGGKRLAKSAFFSLPREPGEQELKAAVLAIPSTAAPGNVTIRIEAADGVIRDLPFVIDSREFIAETIPLNQSNTDIRAAPDPQKTLESEQLWAILSRTGTEIYSGGPFIAPVTSTRKTSFYGDRRVYQYSNGSTASSIHAGVDIGVPTGTEVRASGRGRVVLAKSRIVTGNSVVLEHLPGIYSLYYHLDTIAVSEGAVVEAGALLGRSGSTGLSTGPHLHWEIRVSGENTDPDTFLSRPVLDKKDIFDKLTSY